MKSYNFYKHIVFAAITYFIFMTGWSGLEIALTGKAVHGIVENIVGVAVSVIIYTMWGYKFERDAYKEQLEELQKSTNVN